MSTTTRVETHLAHLNGKKDYDQAAALLQTAKESEYTRVLTTVKPRLSSSYLVQEGEDLNDAAILQPAEMIATMAANVPKWQDTATPYEWSYLEAMLQTRALVVVDPAVRLTPQNEFVFVNPNSDLTPSDFSKADKWLDEHFTDLETIEALVPIACYVYSCIRFRFEHAFKVDTADEYNAYVARLIKGSLLTVPTWFSADCGKIRRLMHPLGIYIPDEYYRRSVANKLVPANAQLRLYRHIADRQTYLTMEAVLEAARSHPWWWRFYQTYRVQVEYALTAAMYIRSTARLQSRLHTYYGEAKRAPEPDMTSAHVLAPILQAYLSVYSANSDLSKQKVIDKLTKNTPGVVEQARAVFSKLKGDAEESGDVTALVGPELRDDELRRLMELSKDFTSRFSDRVGEMIDQLAPQARLRRKLGAPPPPGSGGPPPPEGPPGPPAPPALPPAPSLLPQQPAPPSSKGVDIHKQDAVNAARSRSESATREVEAKRRDSLTKIQAKFDSKTITAQEFDKEVKELNQLANSALDQIADDLEEQINRLG